MTTWTVLIDGQNLSLPIRQQGDALWLAPADFARVSGWQVKEQTLCRDDRCLPLSLHAHLQAPDGWIDITAFAQLQQIPLARADDQKVLSVGTAVEDHLLFGSNAMAPDFTLPDYTGALHSLSDYRGRKILLVVWASWCGCREDLPVWQALHTELADHGLTVITVAQDARVDDALPHVALAKPAHPSLIDCDHIVSQRYGFINVPTVVWIDEAGNIVRPPRLEHARNKFQF